MRLFRPIIHIMRNLKDGQKFSFIGIILGIPIVILTLMFLNEINNEIKWTEKRFQGVHYSRLLKDLLQDVQLFRLYSIGSSIDMPHSKENRDEKELDIRKNLAKISKVTEEAKDDVPSTKQMIMLEKDWIEMDHDISSQKEMFTQYSKYIAHILELIKTVAREHGLIYAKSEFTYLMISDVTDSLPMLTESLGQIRGIGIGTRGEFSETDRQLLISNIALARNSLEKLRLTRNILNDNDSEIIAVLEDTYTFFSYVEDKLLYSTNIDQQASDVLREYVTLIINDSYSLYDVKTYYLEDLLGDQLKQQKTNRGIMLFLLIVAFVLTIYCFVGFYLSLRFTIEDVREEGFVSGYESLSPQLKRVKTEHLKTQQKLTKIERKMSEQVMQAHEIERKRVARELHDSIGQYLYSISVKLSVIKQQTKEVEIKANLSRVMHITEQARKEVKVIAHSLRPGILDDFGLIPALRSYIEDYQQTYDIQVEFDFYKSRERFDPNVETNFYRICQEALTNIAKHANAQFININIKCVNETVHLTIEDDGTGFNVREIIMNSKQRGIGLFSMKERVEAMGGTFEISSSNNGTTVKVQIPHKKSCIN